MGWLWGSSEPSKNDDPYKNLDPSLRKFLDKESPANYTPVQEPSQSPSSTSTRISTHYRDQIGFKSSDPANSSLNKSQQPSTTPEPQTPDPSTVPSASLYPDGRYAHLWKTYQPPSALSSAQSDQERLSTVLDQHNERRSLIARAALENCILEQINEHDCFRNGGWKARMTMCRDESKAFNRCYVMQGRFLKALGYLDGVRTEEQEEVVQMHADKLYHEMLERERVAMEAKAKGEKVPGLGTLIQGADGGLDALSPQRRREVEEAVKGKEGVQRELEIQLAVAEERQGQAILGEAKDYVAKENQKREERKQQGKETFADTVQRLWWGSK
ncbi:hypothetical protein MBLNU457_4756t1 [Dothideomycetes sp. NU457]